MGKSRNLWWLATTLAAALITAVAVQAEAASPGVPQGPACGDRGPDGFGGGGDIPTPFLSSNQRVELADGELYTLIGRVRLVRGMPYLEVDLDQHAWLANPKRKAYPYYPLEGLAEYWKRFEGQKLKNFVEAHATIVISEPYGDGRVNAEHVIGLQPLADPVPVDR